MNFRVESRVPAIRKKKRKISKLKKFLGFKISDKKIYMDDIFEIKKKLGEEEGIPVR